MDHERWQRIEHLYHAARSMPPGARDQFLAGECRGDESLRSEVESLIAQPDATWTGRGKPGDANADEIVGKRLGHYDVQRLLGAGGMGRVYRARDSRLGRDVALKLLPPELTGDPDRLARLEREARLLASLNHPNIATIHGIEDGRGIRALVLEFIEGDTLADRIARGRLPPADALAIACQVKDALDAAHERGIVHRDLKPANIKITSSGLVKVLDFGLAMLEPTPDGGPDGSQAATVTARGTREGIIAGTAAYMSPEQARGLAIDKRTDIWAFGCVLYEMLTGRPAFARGTFTDTLAAIVERDPDWSALPQDRPRGIERLLRRCLEKDRRKRLRDIGDADADLTEAAEPARPRAVWPVVGAALIAMVAAAAAAWSLLGGEAAPPRQFRSIALTILPPDEQRFLNTPVPSPDGTRLAFIAVSPSGRSAIWVRALSDTTAKRLDGTDDAAIVFWSADGRNLGFAADGRLKRIAIDTTTVQTVCVCLTGDLAGASWNAAGIIVFAPHNRAPLHRVSASGGSPEPITTLDPGRNENSHRYPQFLPDGRRLLFTARSDVTRNTGIYLLDIDSGQRRWLFEAQSQAKYVPPGYILFVRERTLLAQPFDVKTDAVSGDSLPLVNDVDQVPASSNASFSASNDGEILSYRSRSQQPLQLVAVHRDGTRRGTYGPEALWQDVKLSPDGKRAALVKVDDVSGNRDIWLMDLPSGRLVRWSSHPANDWRAVWSPDSQSLAFASDRNGASAIFRRRVDGSNEELVAAAAGPVAGRFPDDWSQDDRLVFTQDAQGGNAEMWIGPASPGGHAAVLKGGGVHLYLGGRVSPDGRWVAYASNEAGSMDVYVTSVDGGVKQRISTAGGVQPRWNRQRPELLYYSPADNSLMSVPLKSGTVLHAGSPVRLFSTCLNAPPGLYGGSYELADDGSILWLCPGSQPVLGTVTVSIGWTETLRTRIR